MNQVATRERPAVAGAGINDQFRAVRTFTERLCEPLAVEDHVVQTMPEASPTRWHLAHVSWFFEALILKPHVPGYRSPYARYDYLFNSYYNTLGDQWPRPRRGVLTRPTVEEVYAYRRHVDAAMAELLSTLEPAGRDRQLADLVVLGLNHEQQHQELILTDIKHVLAQNPLFPAYRDDLAVVAEGAGEGPETPLGWRGFAEGLYHIGFDGRGFAYDNETPRHRQFVEAFEMAERPVSNGEYMAFIADGGYRRPELWLSDAWMVVSRESWEHPLYWHREGIEWYEFTLGGLRPVAHQAPVAHLSYYEADAYARWCGARLPTEAQWEVAAAAAPVTGNLADTDCLHPMVTAGARHGLRQLYGDVWEWTASPYVPYPGYVQAGGPLGEYNGKFMCDQLVLRGGSCATPASHVRPTYRNFFPAAARWQFSGLRLARDAGVGLTVMD